MSGPPPPPPPPFADCVLLTEKLDFRALGSCSCQEVMRLLAARCVAFAHLPGALAAPARMSALLASSGPPAAGEFEINTLVDPTRPLPHLWPSGGALGGLKPFYDGDYPWWLCLILSFAKMTAISISVLSGAWPAAALTRLQQPASAMQAASAGLRCPETCIWQHLARSCAALRTSAQAAATKLRVQASGAASSSPASLQALPLGRPSPVCPSMCRTSAACRPCSSA